MTDRDTIRAKVLVILVDAENQPLRLGYATRRLTDLIEQLLTEGAPNSRNPPVLDPPVDLQLTDPEGPTP